MKSRKELLADVIEQEMKDLPEVGGFGESNNLHEYPSVIRYLRTGEYDESETYKNPFLEDAVNSIDMLFTDYDIE